MADQRRRSRGGNEPAAARRGTSSSLPLLSPVTGPAGRTIRRLTLLGLLAVGLLAGCGGGPTLDDEVRRAAEFRASEPLLADEVIGPEHLPGWLLEEADHFSPAEDFDFTDGTLSAAVVALGSLDYVERELSRSDPELYLHVRLTRHPTAGNADSAWDDIELDPEFDVPDRAVRTFEITETGVAGDFERLVAVTSDGPVSVLMELVNNRPDRDPDVDIRAEMARLLELQLAALTPRREFTGTVDFRSFRRSFLRNLGDAMSFLPYIVILLVNVRDPALRDRLRHRTSRFVDLDDSMTTDVTGGAENRRRRRRWDALVLTGVLGVLAFAILAVPFGISGPLGTRLLLILPTLLFVELGRRFYAGRRPVGGLTSTVHLDQVEGSNRVARLFGVVFSVPLLLLGLWLIYLAVFLPIIGLPGADAEGIGSAVSFLRLMGALILVLSMVPWRLARRSTKADLDRIMQRDQRRPVLILRSFVDDRVRIRVRMDRHSPLLDWISLRRTIRFDEFVARMLWGVGPVGALAEPEGGRVDPLGASLHRSSGDWKTDVVHFADQAELVVVIGGRSSGLAWEIEMLKQAGMLAKTIVVFPPLDREELTKRAEAILSLVEERPRSLLLPPGRSLLAFDFGQATAETRYVSLAAEDGAYEEAMEMMLAARPKPMPARPVPPPSGRLPVPHPHSQDVRPWKELPRPKRAWWGRAITYVFVFGLFVNACGDLLANLPQSRLSISDRFAYADGWDLAPLGDDRMVIASSTADDLVELDLDSLDLGRSTAGAGMEELDVDGVSVAAIDIHERRLEVSDWSSEQPRMLWSSEFDDVVRDVAFVDGLVAVAFPYRDRVDLHDRQDGRVVATVSVPGGPTTLAAWGELTLVASANTDTLVAIDPAGELVERYDVPPSPSALWVTGDIAYIASSFDDSVARLDLLAGHIDWVTTVRDVDHRLVVADDIVAVLVKREDANVVLLDAATGELEREFGYGVRLTSLALIGESTFVGLSPVGVIVDDLSEAS